MDWVVQIRARRLQLSPEQTCSDKFELERNSTDNEKEFYRYSGSVLIHRLAKVGDSSQYWWPGRHTCATGLVKASQTSKAQLGVDCQLATYACGRVLWQTGYWSTLQYLRAEDGVHHHPEFKCAVLACRTSKVQDMYWSW